VILLGGIFREELQQGVRRLVDLALSLRGRSHNVLQRGEASVVVGEDAEAVLLSDGEMIPVSFSTGNHFV